MSNVFKRYKNILENFQKYFIIIVEKYFRRIFTSTLLEEELGQFSSDKMENDDLGNIIEIVNAATQTGEAGSLDDKTRIELLTLGNMFLHSSYWFLTLAFNASGLNLPGFAWACKGKEAQCKEAALMIMEFVNDDGSAVEFADIAKPRYDQEDVSAEFISNKWSEIDDWLENKIKRMKEDPVSTVDGMIVTLDRRMGDLLEKLLTKTKTIPSA